MHPWFSKVNALTNETGNACVTPHTKEYVIQDYWLVPGYHKNANGFWIPNIVVPFSVAGQNLDPFSEFDNNLNLCTNPVNVCSSEDLTLGIQVPAGYCLEKTIYRVRYQYCVVEDQIDISQGEGFPHLDDGLYMIHVKYTCCNERPMLTTPGNHVLEYSQEGTWRFFVKVSSMPDISWRWLTSNSGIYTADADHNYLDPDPNYNINGEDIPGDGLEAMDANPILGFTDCGIRYNFPAASNITQYRWTLSFYDNNHIANTLIDNPTWIPYDPNLSYDIDFNNFDIAGDGIGLYFLFGGLGLPGSTPLNANGYQFCIEAEGECGTTGQICRDFRLMNGVGKPNGKNPDINWGDVSAESMDLSIYPNPTTGIINMESKETIVSIQIFNAVGEVIQTFNTNLQNWQYDMNEWRDGVYFLKIIDINNQSSFKKVIKQ